MNFTWLKTAFTTGKRFTVKNLPTILTILSGTGTVTAVIFAVKDTPKAEKRIEARKQELNVEKLPPMEVFKTCWPVYIPTAGMTLMSIACGISANSINLKRNAALAGLYATTEHTLQEYRKKVIDTIGEEAERDIHQHAAEKALSEEPEIPAIAEIKPELFYDEMAKRWFWSDIYTIRDWISSVKERVADQMYISSEEVYGLNEQEAPDICCDLGWTVDDRLRIKTEEHRKANGQRYTSIIFSVPPHENYYKMY